ncbi:MAG: sigma-70 family RNA polymerase sigma factor [Nocardiopsaceae bacterium]|jgi:RNA polymerase sigma factor (sigma-70 family)|nr:sigma-70 family RNA polymerase sigma factor [Nocardiopsaceae bacterium]
MRDDPVVVALVARAAEGDQTAWNDIVERYAPLVWSICGRYQLSSQDVEDIGQTVWLRLVEQLGNLREPAALPGWIATTTQRECVRVRRAACRTDRAATAAADDLESLPGPAMIEQDVITAETHAALRAALAELPLRCRQLLTMLMSEPARSYGEISTILQIPIGSIGPQRGRCLQRLRRSGCLAAHIDYAV